MSVVIDASALSEMLAQSSLGRRVEQWLGDGVHAPDLIYLEVVSVVRGLRRSDTISAARAGQMVTDLKLFRMDTWPHAALVDPVWRLRDNFSAYDASYVALAIALDIPLLTTDARLYRAAQALNACELVDLS